MDKTQAQFILHSFRPDGADAADADFTEALQLATEDRELGEWLADERAADAAFAKALCEVEIPDQLRMHILSVMRGEKPTDPAMEEEMDGLLRNALAHVEPPVGLRDQILAAMHVQQNLSEDVGVEDRPKNVTAMNSDTQTPPAYPGRVWFRVASLAAAVVLGGFLALQIDLGKEAQPPLVTQDSQVILQEGTQGGAQRTFDGTVRVSSHDVQQVAGRILNSKFDLDVKHPEKNQVNSWLAANELPAPARLPVGLQGMKIMGCKKIQLPNGTNAALLCFIKSTGGMVHLVVINNEFIKDDHLPSMGEITQKDCYNCPKSGWNTIRWRDRENTFVLFAKKEASSDQGVIQYF